MRWLKLVTITLGSFLTVQAMAATQHESSTTNSRELWSKEDRVTWPKTGVGVGLGPISGLSLYHTYASEGFLQGLVAINGGGNYFLSGDFCTIVQKLVPKLTRLNPYFGFGLMTQRADHDWYHWARHHHDDYDHDNHYDVSLGGRIPIGVNYTIPETPLMVTAELAPGILIVPGTYATLQGMVALRALF